MKNASIQLEALTCPTCMQKIEAAVRSVKGVDPASVRVLFNASKAKAAFDDSVTSLETIVNAIQNIGYSVIRASEK